MRPCAGLRLCVPCGFTRDGVRGGGGCSHNSLLSPRGVLRLGVWGESWNEFASPGLRNSTRRKRQHPYDVCPQATFSRVCSGCAPRPHSRIFTWRTVKTVTSSFVYRCPAIFLSDKWGIPNINSALGFRDINAIITIGCLRKILEPLWYVQQTLTLINRQQHARRINRG